MPAVVEQAAVPVEQAAVQEGQAAEGQAVAVQEGPAGAERVEQEQAATVAGQERLGPAGAARTVGARLPEAAEASDRLVSGQASPVAIGRTGS